MRIKALKEQCEEQEKKVRKAQEELSISYA